MNKVPPELDRLMWTLAEEGNPKALEEFGGRYPDHVAELGRRLSMVRGLRGGKKTLAAATVPAIPTFSLRRTESRSPFQWTLIGALVTGAVAAACYTVWLFGQPVEGAKNLQTVKSDAPVIAPPAVSGTDPVIPPAANPVYSDHLPSNNPTQAAPLPSAPITTPRENVAKTPSYLKPKSVKWREVKLISAIRLLSAESQLQVEIAPGFQDQTIDVDIQDRNTIEILKELGKRYGFTVMEQGEGQVLVVPAVDGANQPPTTKIGG